jgi:acetyl esterase/lipase
MVPEVSFAAEVDDGAAVYRQLLADGVPAGDVVLCGDSAGAQLAFAVALRAREDGLPRPAALVGLSGCYDLDFTEKLARSDGVRALGTDLAAGPGHVDLTDPLLSPLRADLTGMPPTLLTTGSDEFTRPDSEEMVRRLAAAGVPCTLQLWDRQPHMFRAFPWLLEAGASLTRIGRADDGRRRIRRRGIAVTGTAAGSGSSDAPPNIPRGRLASWRGSWTRPAGSSTHSCSVSTMSRRDGPCSSVTIRSTGSWTR